MNAQTARTPSTKEFMDWFWSDNKTYGEFRFIKKGRSVRTYFCSPDAIRWDVIEKAQADGFNIYFAVCLRKVKSGTKKDVFSCSALWVDLDAKDFPGGKEEALSQLEKLPAHLQPTIIIDSGHGYHCYWILREPYEIKNDVEIDFIERNLKGLCSHISGDQKVTDLSRIMRLPGTQNVKDPEKPVPCEVISWNENRFNLDDFSEFIKNETQVKTNEKVTHNGSMPPPVDRIKRATAYLATIAGAVSGESGHDQTWKAALAIVKGFSLSEDVALDLLRREYNPRCNPHWSEKEILHKITQAAKSNLPDGYLLKDSTYSQKINGNSQSDFEESSPEPKRQPEPKISNDAFYGLAGKAVHMLEPHTEAHPVALLVSFLAELGCIISRGAHLVIDDTRHSLLFWPVLVGASSKSRKGSSSKRIRAIFKEACPDWTRGLNSGQLSSGEGLVWAIRDKTWKPEIIKGQDTGEEIIDDEGVEDKRLLLVQTEFGSMLKIMSREGNSLSGLIRCAWDGDDLIPMTSGRAKKNIRVTEPLVSIVAHVTQPELLRNLSETESSNGFGNRFAWFFVKRSKELPFPGSPEESEKNKITTCIKEAIACAEDVDEITLTEDARTLWQEVYHDLSKDRPGLAGSLLNRSEAYVMRLSAIYALLDCKSVIDTPHMLAALALWGYAIDSTFFIFGNKTGDSIADAILEGIKRAGGEGMSDADINNLFGGHRKSSRLNAVKQNLKDAALIVDVVRKTEGRNKTVWLLS